MEVVVLPRQGGKTTKLLAFAAERFAYIVCPTKARASQLWEEIQRQGLDVPQPITWDAFVHARYVGRGIKSFAIDDVDLCIQSMTRFDIVGVTLSGNPDGVREFSPAPAPAPAPESESELTPPDDYLLAPAAGVCTGCGRSTYSRDEVGQACGMTQPGGDTCVGMFVDATEFARMKLLGAIAEAQIRGDNP
ncbi:hypothetical protein [Mycolicibacterium sphagni]|uniref:hypothetical protein n=1 Tax=Mycolicibacterium sphagni TaxID=1786 RepID=UPI0021F33D4B|nr:hypothetical protein [Mycolicibacterium sphagni]MCV7174785.1 hypothetical protein [Mycolicibacterium sphagni]